MEFVVYMGKNAVVTVSGDGLSKVYRLEKGKPVVVDNADDKHILLLWQERSPSSCCGGSRLERNIMSDYAYCMMLNLDIEKMRDEISQSNSN